MLPNNHQSFLLPSSSTQAFSCPPDNNNDGGFSASTKRKRRPAGTPDPDAEVVYLTPEMLMESDRYVCEICNQSFQREQNLQMHRRRHKVPWKLLKRDNKQDARKRVYVCPEPSCLHHNPAHALGDLVGIKKHFRRKHSNQKQFVCDKCSKGYAVQSDYKAHLKICGTKGHSCDCGRVFSRVETFIEHQDSCKARFVTNTTSSDLQATKPAVANSLPQEASPSAAACFSSGSNNSKYSMKMMPADNSRCTKLFSSKPHQGRHHQMQDHHNLELGLELFSSNVRLLSLPNNNNWVSAASSELNCSNVPAESSILLSSSVALEVSRLKNEAALLLQTAMEQKALAEKKRQEAKCLVEMAKQDMTNARKIREQVLEATHNNNNNSSRSVLHHHHHLQVVTCHACKKGFQHRPEDDDDPAAAIAVDYFSSAGGARKENGAKGSSHHQGFLHWSKELTSTS